MGKWNNRRIPNPRSYRHDNRGWIQREFPPPYPAESSESSVPEWEKKFCYLVGSVPWRKVLNTKTFASCYPDVMNWDDSEARDAFHTAKRRFWAQMNGLPTDDAPLPDPDAYIDQVDWNTCIDTSLYTDIENALLPTDVDTKVKAEVGGVVDISALTQKSKWQEWNNGTDDDVRGSGGCWDTFNSGVPRKPTNDGWEEVNVVTNEPKFAKGGNDSWDCGPPRTNVPVKNTAWGPWGDCNDKSWGWKQPQQFYSTTHNMANPNDGNFQGSRAMKNSGCGVSGKDSCGMQRQQNTFRESKAWGYGSIQHNGASAAREWGKHGENSQYHNSSNNGTETRYKISENQYWGNKGDRKRESPNNYAPRSKSPRFQRMDNIRHDRHEPVRPCRNVQSMQRACSSFRT